MSLSDWLALVSGGAQIKVKTEILNLRPSVLSGLWGGHLLKRLATVV